MRHSYTPDAPSTSNGDAISVDSRSTLLCSARKFVDAGRKPEDRGTNQLAEGDDLKSNSLWDLARLMLLNINQTSHLAKASEVL